MWEESYFLNGDGKYHTRVRGPWIQEWELQLASLCIHHSTLCNSTYSDAMNKIKKNVRITTRHHTKHNEELTLRLKNVKTSWHLAHAGFSLAVSHVGLVNESCAGSLSPSEDSNSACCRLL